MRTGPKGEMRILAYDFVDFRNEFCKLKNEIVDKKLLDISKLNDFQITFIAQHYGLLTPTLDWSADPLVALFFALDGYVEKDDEFPVVCILKPGFCNRWSSIVYKDNITHENKNITTSFCIDYSDDLFDELTKDLNDTIKGIPFAIYSKLDLSHRISRQSGKFTLHGAVGPLNYQWNDTTIEGRKLVDTIKISNDVIEEIKEYLQVLNINKKTIYRKLATPLDNICSQIQGEELEKFIRDIKR